MNLPDDPNKLSMCCPACNTVTFYDRTALSVACPKCGITSGNPFAGEMVCVMCGKKKIQTPEAPKSDWRFLEYGFRGKRYGAYACIDHFPPDGSPAYKFQRAYAPIMQVIIGKIFSGELKPLYEHGTTQPLQQR